jgi:hypothetical protein
MMLEKPEEVNQAREDFSGVLAEFLVFLLTLRLPAFQSTGITGFVTAVRGLSTV